MRDEPLAAWWGVISGARWFSGKGLSASLTELVPEFEGLRSRLPAELLGEGDPFNPDEEGLCVVRDEVRDLLMARLAEGGHDH